MPDAGGRIKRSAIDSMCMMLLSLTSLYEDSDPKMHPRMCVIFNDVSKIEHKQKVAPTYGVKKDNQPIQEDEEEIEERKEVV